MTFSEYVDGMPSGVIKTLFRMLQSLLEVCTTIADYSTSTLREIIVDVLEWAQVPDYQTAILDKILSGPWAFIYNITLFDILLGTALIAVIIFGIIKYFTDIIF